MTNTTLFKRLTIAAFVAVFALTSCEKEDINDDNNNDGVPTTADFSEIELEEESYWNGSDESGGFKSGNVFFPNSFTDWGDGVTSWAGFSVSNITDNETPGFENEYSNITGSGVDGASNYAVAYISDPETYEKNFSFDLVDEAKGDKIEGMFITNSTYAYFTIRDGDDYTQAFDQDDWFLVTFTGYLNGETTNSVEFYLADFRSSDESEHYIVNTWEWIDLLELGNVDKVKISLSSSDVGDYGMNTPSYICIGKAITIKE